MLLVDLASGFVQLKGDEDLGPPITCCRWQEQVCCSQPGRVGVWNILSPPKGLISGAPWLGCDQRCSSQVLRVGLSPHIHWLRAFSFETSLGQPVAAIPDLPRESRPYSSLNL